jgi:hypothetical protein
MALPTATPMPTATRVPTVTPVPTATPIPLADIDLVPLLVQPGDLPAGVTTGQVVRDGEAYFIKGAPNWEQKLFLEFGAQSQSAGGVVIWLLDAVADREDAYTKVADWFEEDAQAVEGEWDSVVANPPPVSAANVLSSLGLMVGDAPLLGEMAFEACQAVVYVQLPYDREILDPIVTYSGNLLARLQPQICRS